MSGEIIRIRYHFVGHVQNRGFRFACYTCARRVGVSGWARNERDGTVTAEVQGTPSEQRRWLVDLTGLVDGFGDGWSVGHTSAADAVPGERGFSTRRY